LTRTAICFTILANIPETEISHPILMNNLRSSYRYYFYFYGKPAPAAVGGA
jgi:hypothetical protein